MDPVAVSSAEELGAVARQRSVRNRKFSLYAARIKPLNLGEPEEEVPQIPDLPPAPVSPRWDSLSHGPHVVNQTAAASPTQASHPDVPFGPTSSNGLPSPTVPSSPGLRSHRSFTTGPSGGLDSRNASPSRPLTAKSSTAELRPDGTPPVENFSRPRKQSIRQTGPPDGFAQEPVVPRLASAVAHSPPMDQFYELSNATPQTPPWQQPRRPSVSSMHSGPPIPSEYGEPRSYRARNITSPPVFSPPARTVPNSLRDGSALTTPLTSPVFGGAPPWMGPDELRSSFRSQFTASTTPGTALTERSSVLTKDSSVTSLYGNPDEPSVDDVMNMYVKGFADDEEDSGSNYGDESEANLDSRPATAVSEPDLGPALRVPEVSLPDVPAVPSIPPSAASTTKYQLTPGLSSTPIASAASSSPSTPAMTSLAPPASPASPAASSLLAPPTARSTLDAEIRQSKLIFTNPDFISSLPAISNAEMDNTEKRDSSKSLDSEPSISSDPPTNTESKQAASPSSSVSVSPATSPTPMPPDASVEPEDPGSRDRYGFKKASHAITREQYDAWNKEYSIYLARRRRKWTTYLKDSALMTDRPIRFPGPCTKTKRFVRKGIPPDWRGAAWFYYAGGPAILSKHSGLYEKLLQKQAKQVDVEAIERDLHRTFPDNIQFKPSPGAGSPTNERVSQSTATTDSSIPGPPPTAGEPPIISSLRRVLHAFSIYNPRIGYCQSLNFLAGLLLLFVETEEQCFWLLNVITIIYLPGTHDMSLEGSKVDLGVLMTELRDTMPAVWDKIGGDLEGPPTNSRPSTSKSVRRPMAPILRRKEHPRLSTERLPPITLCMTAWFMSCFIGTLPIETTLRVWDVFFYEGSKTLFRTALAILKSGENEIKAVKDPMETFGVVQALPRRMLDANALMESCFKRRNGFGHLSQGVIDERREERRQRAKQDRQETLRRGTTDPGHVEESASVSRRGTLFGKKKREPSMPRAPEV